MQENLLQQNDDLGAPLASGLYSNSMMDGMAGEANDLPVFPEPEHLVPTSLEVLPELGPNLNIKFEDPPTFEATDFPDLPALPGFTYDAKIAPPALNLATSEEKELNSVSDMLMSDCGFTPGLGSATQIPNLPVPVTASDDMDSSQFHSSGSSSGMLPEFLPVTPMGMTVDGLPIRNCELCERPVELDGLVANGLYYHKLCANCTKCGQRIQGNRCAMFKGKLFCVACVAVAGPLEKCPVCGMFLDGSEKEMSIPEIKLNIHANCLCCQSCSRTLGKGQHMLLGDRIYCRRCFPAARERVCRACKETIEGRYVKCKGCFYHVEHFKCAVCQKILCGNNYIVHHNKPYCPEHGRVFVGRCKYCKGRVLPTDMYVKWQDALYHAECLVCRVCGAHLIPSSAQLFHNRPHCQVCLNLRREEMKCVSGKRHKHIPILSRERRKRFAEHAGIEIIEPTYSHSPNVWLEEARQIEPEESAEMSTQELILDSV